MQKPWKQFPRPNTCKWWIDIEILQGLQVWFPLLRPRHRYRKSLQWLWSHLKRVTMHPVKTLITVNFFALFKRKLSINLICKKVKDCKNLLSFHHRLDRKLFQSGVVVPSASFFENISYCEYLILKRHSLAVSNLQYWCVCRFRGQERKWA